MKIDYKIPKGKLLRLQIEIDNDIIKEIKITGDFFIYPESAIIDIEKFLRGKNVKKIEKLLAVFLREENIEIIGFAPKDLQEALTGP